ncbi:MAG: hypothetical protein II169_08975 [Lachnospiraceae bacterium]|nr:hypothetical protein [Lachnospiraceae bacterium]
MILRNASLDKKKSFFQLLTINRKWISLMVVFVAFAYFPLLTIFTTLHAREIATHYEYSSVLLHKYVLNSVSAWIGFRSYAFIISGVLGFIIALQGFHYLTDSKMMDFYGSLPYKKSRVFRNVYANGIFLYIVPWTICTVISLCIAAGLKMANQALILDVIYGVIVNALVFLFVYSVTVLACVITGRTIIAAAISLLMLMVEPVMELILDSFTTVFFKTYYYSGVELVLKGLNPLMRYFVSLNKVRWNTWDMTFKDVHGNMEFLLFPLFLCLLFSFLATVLALICYNKRREESAGSAFAFPLVRSIAKPVVTIAACLSVTMFVNTSFSNRVSLSTTAISIISIIAVGVMSSIILEIILDMNVRAGKQHLMQMGVAILVSIAIYGIFRMDLIGYDSYLPKANQIESFALFSENNSSLSDYYTNDESLTYDMDADYWSIKNYFEQHLYLTDVDDLIQVVKASQKYMNDNPETYASNGYEFTVIYRLTSGKTVYRTIVVDPDMDKTYLDNIMGQDDYHECAYKYFSNDDVKSSDSVQLTFSNGEVSISALGQDFYENFVSNYRKDVVKYNYSLATSEKVVGCVDVTLTRGSGTSMVTTTASYEIYPSYQNTIQFLEDSGLYDSEFISSKYIKSIQVSDYESGDYYETSNPDKIDEIAQYLESSHAEFYFGNVDDSGTLDITVTTELVDENGNSSVEDGTLLIDGTKISPSDFIELFNE